MAVVIVAATLRADVAKFDTRIAADFTQADTNGVVWVDGRNLPLESKAFADADGYYGRMPSAIASKVSKGVAAMARHSTGHYFIFVTDSPTLAIEWILEEKEGRDPYIPPQGMYGVDIYCKGTSIVNGGSASRPGLCFTSIAGRTVDVPYVNLGFSGCARLEIEMAEALALIDASLYIVDPAWR